MEDDLTRSQWLHYTGECVTGPLAGRQLELFPTTAMNWGAFREAFPEGDTIPEDDALWRRLMGYVAGARGLHALPPLFRKTMRAPDPRLPEGELGLGVFVGRKRLLGAKVDARFYRFADCRAKRLVRDDLAGRPLAVYYHPSADVPLAVWSELEGAAIDLALDHEGRLVDHATGARFDLVGRALSGPFAGKRLELASSIWTRWYGWAQTYPDTSLWAP